MLAFHRPCIPTTIETWHPISAAACRMRSSRSHPTTGNCRASWPLLHITTLSAASHGLKTMRRLPERGVLVQRVNTLPQSVLFPLTLELFLRHTGSLKLCVCLCLSVLCVKAAMSVSVCVQDSRLHNNIEAEKKNAMNGC